MTTLLARLAGPPPAAGRRRGSTLLTHLFVAAVLVGVMVVATGQIELFWDFQLAQIAAYLCAVAGLTVLTGQNGQVSLGHSALMAVGAYTVAKMQTLFSDHDVTTGWTLLYSLCAAVVVTGVVGLLIGLAAARLRGPYLAGLTLAIVVMIPSITARWHETFGGDQGLSVPLNPPPADLGEGFPTERWQAWFATIAAAVTMLLLANLIRSRFGRSMRAVRDNEVAAQLVGIPVARTQVVAFVVSACAAGLGGGVYAAMTQVASPGGYSLTLSLYLLLAIVLGGLGSLFGAVWGAVAIVVLPYWTQQLLESNQSSSVKNNLPLAIFGIALIVIAILAPGGIQGLLRRAGHWIRRRLRASSPPPLQPDRPVPAPIESPEVTG